MNSLAKTGVRSVSEQDLRLLRIFRVVAEAGGLTAAEATLHMERSTISRHLQALEARLGGSLCARGPGGFGLTDLGRDALRAAITAEDMLAQVRDDLNRAQRVVTGDLRLGIADYCMTNPEAKLVEILSKFRTAAPAVELHLHVKPPVDLLADVLAGRCHLAIAGTVSKVERIESRFLFREEFSLWVASTDDEPPTLRRLCERGHALVTRDSDQRSLALSRRLGIERRLVASGLEAVALLVAGGGCFGFLPTHLATALPFPTPLRRVDGGEDLTFETDFALLRDRGRPLGRPAELFREILCASYGAVPAGRSGFAGEADP